MNGHVVVRDSALARKDRVNPYDLKCVILQIIHRAPQNIVRFSFKFRGGLRRSLLGRKHGGVVFVDEKTISLTDIGGLVWALTRLLKETGKWDWTNRVSCLRR